jgi:hypothetical protein
MNSRLRGLCFFILSAMLCHAAGTGDAKAHEVAANMMNAMGGPQAWKDAHFVRFDFIVNAGGKAVVSRSHLWDKQTGRYRLEQKTKTGEPQIVLFNIATKEGMAYVNGKKLEGADAKKAVEGAYGAFINDMYWLSMPWKWMDQGVHLKSLGPQTRGGNAFDVVELSFDHVGLTPGDHYRAFVSQKSHLMTHWEYTLQSGDKGSWDWEYGDYGGVKLAKNHTSADGKSINMGSVAVLSKADDAYFTDPNRSIAELK